MKASFLAFLNKLNDWAALGQQAQGGDNRSELSSSRLPFEKKQCTAVFTASATPHCLILPSIPLGRPNPSPGDI